MNFPSEPVDYQVHQDAGRTWVFIPERQTWQVCKEPPIPHKSQHISGPDSITPAEIGAASLTQLAAVLQRLMALENRLPQTPVYGTHALKAVDGVLTFVADS
jgi:hypothetical protein